MSNRLKRMAAGVAPPSARAKAGRVRVLAFGFALAFCAVTARVGLLSASGLDLGGRASTPEAHIPQPMLRDVNGDVLARTLPSLSLMADPQLVLDPAETAQSLATVLPDIDVPDLTERLSTNRQFEWVQRHLTPAQSQAVHMLGLPGLAFRNEGKRVYFHNQNFSHVLGFRGLDGEGLSGFEAFLDSSGLGAAAETAGSVVDLTLDGRIQLVLREELGIGIEEFQAVSGAGVIVDVATGGIAALVSLPDFNPHRPGDPRDADKLNLATKGRYELGSVLKILNSAIALDSGVAALSDRFDATKPMMIDRFRVTDYDPQNRWLTLAETFRYSSNIASAQIAKAIGTTRQRGYFSELGLLDPLPVELPERRSPQFPDPWTEAYSLTMAYGYGIAVTPLHLASATAAAIGDGVYRPPTLLKSVADDTARGHRVFRQETVDKMRRLLRMVVTHGTGRRAEVAGYLPGGKTGTAESATGDGYDRGRLVSTFVSAFPMNRPEYVVLIMLVNPQGNAETHNYSTAGWVAAPIAGRVVTRMGPLLGMPPQSGEDPEILQAMALSESALPPEVR